MPEHVSANTSERPRSRKLIEDMLQERQQMLVLLWELSKLDFAKVGQNIRETLEEFQELLVDYIATGHFGLYQRISEGTERRQGVLETARGIYPRIAKTTDVAMEFADKYEALDTSVIQARLTTDLSTLAEEIATRIELEDRLILAMLGNEYTIPAQGSAA